MENPVIIYLSPFDLLRPRTNQVSDVRFCEGFAQQGCEVHLIVPYSYRKDNIAIESVPQYYGLTTPFHLHYLATDFKGEVSGLRKLMVTAWYGQQAIRKILDTQSSGRKVIILSRNGILLLPYLTLKKTGGKIWKKTRIIHWLHDLKLKAKDRYIYKNCNALLATNNSILTDLFAACKLKNIKSTFTLNPITQAQAEEEITRAEARKNAGLTNISTPLIVYTGKIGFNYNKELLHILDAASALPDYTFLFTGGTQDAVNHWENHCKENNIHNVIFTGYIADYTQIKNYQYAADVLVSYYTTQGHDPRYNLPNKICEYMLTGNPIVTPDYPATRELLNTENCFFTAPENSSALTEMIRYVILHPEEARLKGTMAKLQVKEITFSKTAARLIHFFNELK